MANLIEDGLPDVSKLAPKRGRATWLYWFRDGRLSDAVIEIVTAKPAGHYHVAICHSVHRSPTFGPSLFVSRDALVNHCAGIIEALGGEHFVWLPTPVEGMAPSASYARLH